MSDRASNSEIEDVLASIRRLVSGEDELILRSRAPAARADSAVQGPVVGTKGGGASEAGADKVVTVEADAVEADVLDPDAASGSGALLLGPSNRVIDMEPATEDDARDAPPTLSGEGRDGAADPIDAAEDPERRPEARDAGDEPALDPQGESAAHSASDLAVRTGSTGGGDGVARGHAASKLAMSQIVAMRALWFSGAKAEVPPGAEETAPEEAEGLASGAAEDLPLEAEDVTPVFRRASDLHRPGPRPDDGRLARLTQGSGGQRATTLETDVEGAGTLDAPSDAGPAEPHAPRRSGFAFGVKLDEERRFGEAPDGELPAAPRTGPIRPLWTAAAGPGGSALERSERDAEPAESDDAAGLPAEAEGAAGAVAESGWSGGELADREDPDWHGAEETRRTAAEVEPEPELDSSAERTGASDLAAWEKPGAGDTALQEVSNLFGTDDGAGDAALRSLVARVIEEELQGALGERITRNLRKLVRREIQRALASRDFEAD